MRFLLCLAGFAALIVAVPPALACVGGPKPVDVTFGRDTVSIDVGKGLTQALTSGYRVTWFASKPLGGEDGQEVTAVVANERTWEAKTYVFVVPPPARAFGACNQPYLKQ